MPPIPAICRVIFSKPEAALISSRASVRNPSMTRGGKTNPSPPRTSSAQTSVFSSVCTLMQANQYEDAAARRKPSTRKMRGLHLSVHFPTSGEMAPVSTTPGSMMKAACRAVCSRKSSRNSGRSKLVPYMANPNNTPTREAME